LINKWKAKPNTIPMQVCQKEEEKKTNKKIEKYEDKKEKC
jgi:hypothetical protein